MNSQRGISLAMCGLGKYLLPGLSHHQAKPRHFFQEEAFQVMDQMAQAGGAHELHQGPRGHPSCDYHVTPPMIPSAERLQEHCPQIPKMPHLLDKSASAAIMEEMLVKRVICSSTSHIGSAQPNVHMP